MMYSPRFFCPDPLAVGAQVLLPPGAARHAARVLRLGVGAMLTLFDGRGGEFSARIVSVHKDEVGAEVLTQTLRECESPLRVTLVQSLQSGDKMDLTVQKAVELGVTRIQPVSSRRSVVRLEGERAARRVEHWRGVVASACEQCGRNRLPSVEELVPLSEWLSRLAAQNALDGELRLMLAPGGAGSLLDLPAAEHVTLLIGAEGGLDEREQEAAVLAGFLPVRMGPRVLRTETAGLAALAALQVMWGDFGI